MAKAINLVSANHTSNQADPTQVIVYQGEISFPQHLIIIIVIVIIA
jgi:hypothetical protein